MQNEYYDEYNENNTYEENDIDNSELSYHGNNICITLNPKDERRNKLKTSEEVLCKKFPNIKNIVSDNKLQEIINNVFPEGFNKQMYIRNLTFEKNGHDIIVLAIRPEIYPGDYLHNLLPEGTSLLFKGHLGGKEFIIDSIHEVADTEQLDFEVDGTAIPYRNPSMITWNFLYDIKDNAESLTQYTGEKLQEWREYLQWKKEFARRQVHGCKYFKITFDEDSKKLIFWLVCENKEYFQIFRKYLYRDVQVFNNDYSQDEWRFNLARYDFRKKYDRSIEVGRCKGVVEEYYLNTNEVEDINIKQNTIEDRIAIDKISADDYFDDIYNEDEYESENSNESDISKIFTNPYVVQVAYDLNRNDLDEINSRNLEDSEIISYVYENVLGNYYKSGFLALSAVGDFVLINRFEQALKQLEMDECYSPNLAMWLFNVDRARLPQRGTEVVIDKWLNKNIENNENQKSAVYKMLQAPDLCLIQGPPGTGKTTVIAEAIYQFVKKGNRVLVASQSNDAVDNALERLADTPEIRAIRVGQKARKKKIDTLNTRKFSEDEALKYYYNALSKKVSSMWLDLWTNIDNLDLQYDTDIRDAEMFRQDISELNTEYAKIITLESEERQLLINYKKQFDVANENNTDIQNDKQQFQALLDNIENNSDEPFFLSINQLKILESKLNPVIEKAINNGVYLTPSTLDINIIGEKNENLYLSIAIKSICLLEKLKKKIVEPKNNQGNNDASIILLQRRYDEVKDEMVRALIDDDDDVAAVLKKKLKSIAKEIDELKYASSVIIISDDEKNILSKEFIEQINSFDRDILTRIIDDIRNSWSQQLEKGIIDIRNYMDSQKIISVSSIKELIKVSEDKIQLFRDQLAKIKKNIDGKSRTLEQLSTKYKIDSTDSEVIIEQIKDLKRKNKELYTQQKSMRDDWESILKSFKERLNDKDSFKYDQTYYQQIYINACNVVGISCTDNMKNLSDNGYNDFDVVIIDEVSKATPPELLIPLMKARKAILVGDHRQLPPMFKEHEGTYEELVKNQEDAPEEIRSLLTNDNFTRFKNMVTSSLFKEYFENADDSIKHSLLVQYRMHSDIMNIINRFYDHRLENGLSSFEENKTKKHDLTIKGIDNSQFIIPSNHAYWIDSSTLPSGIPINETYINKSTSASNILEKYIIIELLKKIADTYKNQGYTKENRKTVGIISFYQMQVNEIREAFKQAKKKFNFSTIDVDINTVDRFQGKEKNIIITSLVRNNKQAKASKHVVAFERINVAFSRAQEMLFIVGAKHMYEHSRIELPNMNTPGFKTVLVYQNIMEDLNRKACFKGSEKLITPEIEKLILKEYGENGGKE